MPGLKNAREERVSARAELLSAAMSDERHFSCTCQSISNQDQKDYRRREREWADLAQCGERVLNVTPDVGADGHAFDLVYEPDDALERLGAAPDVLDRPSSKKCVKFPL